MANMETPKNWKFITTKESLDFVLGGDWGKDPLKFEDKDYTEVLCIRGSEIKHWQKNKGSTAVRRLIKNSSLEKRKLQLGDILIEISGGGPDQPVGRTVYVDQETLGFEPDVDKVCTNFLRLIRFKSPLNSKFINKFFDYFYLSGQITKYQGGSNNLRNLKFKEFETIKIPLPPRTEQDRIVAKVDALMAHVTVMQESLARIPQLLSDFRQQVLTQAVTGKLTEEWREGKELESGGSLLQRIKKSRIESYNELIKNVTGRKPRKPIFQINLESDKIFLIPSNWTQCFIGDIGEVCNGSTPSRKVDSYWNGNIPWVSSGLVQNNRIDITNEFITKEGFNKSSVRLLPIGTVLIAMIGEGKTRGQSAILNIEATTNQNIAGIIIDHKLVCSEYLQYWFLFNYEENRTKGSGTGPQALNGQKVRELDFVLPPLKEQQEIVRCVESLFSKADAIQLQYETLKQKIGTLPQAILHKAFKGELVEQLDSDGSAEELLREIEGVKINTKAQSEKKVYYFDGDIQLERVAEEKIKYK